MKPNRGENGLSTAVPPWLIIGAVAVLVPLFGFSTVDTINRQKENSTRLMLEMGAALIRSFEAGTRTGMRGGMHPDFKLQKLLTETAQQPDIVYLAVADVNGRIIAHNDLGRIGTRLAGGLDPAVVASQDAIAWREVPGPDGKMIFEVYSRFIPTGKPRRTYMGMMRTPGNIPKHRNDRARVAPGVQMIYVGLDMTGVKAAAAADVHHAVWMGVILLLVGFAGVVLLFLVQGYSASRASLSQAQAFSDTLVENMPTGLIALDADRLIAMVNPAAQSTLHLPADQLLGQPAATGLPRELYSQIDRLENSGTLVDVDIDCTLADGSRIPISLSGGALNDEQQVSHGHVLLFRDLSEVYALRREISLNQRLAAVGRLAAGVAHEIRNPLSSIKGFATYFKERAESVSEDHKIAEIMIQEVDRLNRVISQLLEFSRPVTLSPKTVAAHSLIESSIQLVDREAESRRVQIETRLSPRVKAVHVDPDRIRQVLLNLYLNAIEAMGEGGSLIVALDPGKDPGMYRIRVSDTGSGIPEQDLAHVFDPYFTTKSSGTGLGLAIVHNIVEALAGQISIESRPEGGISVTLILPGLRPPTPEA